MTAAELREAREAGANPAEVRAAFLAARGAMFVKLAATPTYTQIGETVNANLIFQQVNDEIALLRNQPVAQGTYHINYDYLSADPYLSRHNVDIDSVIPQPVPDMEFRNIFAALEAACPAYVPDFRVSEDNVNTAPLVRDNVRKRFKRLYDFARQQTLAGIPSNMGYASPVHDLAELLYTLASQGARCIIGIQDALGRIEDTTLGTGGDPRHIGDFISSVLTDYKVAYINRHAELVPPPPDNRFHYREFRTQVVATLDQTLKFSLGLRGGSLPLHHPYFGWVRLDPGLRPAPVMRRFLEGQMGCQLDLPLGTPDAPATTVDFEPYNQGKMVALLQAAWAKGQARNANGTRVPYTGSPCSLLQDIVIMTELIDPTTGDYRSPTVGPKYMDFCNSGYLDGNEYFTPSLNPAYPEDYRLTDEFWIFVLRKYNYIEP